MSFRLFIYYCALAGALSALAGWGLGRLLVHDRGLAASGVKGLLLAFALALALSLVDALWNVGPRRPFFVAARVLCAVVVGTAAGLVGALVGEGLYSLLNWPVFIVLGYALVGLLIGAALGLFDLLAALGSGRDPAGALRKTRSGLLGGALGGLLGGSLSVALRFWWETLFADRDQDKLLSPSAVAFAALGLFIGLLIGLAQVILKQAWLRVEQGFRAGRELILARDEITIGRAETCDVGLFGDATVERLHARIVRQGGEYVLSDAGTPAGTYVNERRLDGPQPLRAGDAIRVGRCVLLFGERPRR